LIRRKPLEISFGIGADCRDFVGMRASTGALRRFDRQRGPTKMHRPIRPSRVLPLVTLCLLLSGCGGGDDSAPPPGGPHAGGRGGAPAKAVPVAVLPAFTGDIATRYQATATLEAEKQTEVLARVEGLAAGLAVEEGDPVQAGQVLMRIENGEYKLRVDQAAARTANLRARFQRFEAMLAEGLTAAEEYETARSELAAAEADEGLARLEMSYTTVRAPFAGRVTARRIDPGRNVSVGTPLFELADFDPLLARVHVPSREFNKLRTEQDVELVLDSDGVRLAGRIKLISPVIDPASGTIKVTVEVPEPPTAVRPGDFAAVRIVTEQRRGVLLVPVGAVLADNGERVCYVAVDEGEGPTAERRVVEVGFTDDLNAQIVAGLAPGERVVVKGQRTLTHGAALKILDDAVAGSEG
jgi:membrane fusion protein (multidrug efflux system)